MTFTEYAEIHLNKSRNTPTVIEQPLEDSPKDAFTFSKDLNPDKWTAKIIGEEKYLFYNNHYLNMSELRKEIKKIYRNNGYDNYGFSKLSESELIRYKTVKDFLIKEFCRNDTDELDPAATAEIIFNREIKDFDWKPEPLTM